jgi:uncharacterized protein YodC (DUF2158 family)
MTEEFKAGDTVRLKSGGPLMTIQEIDGAGFATCDWFTKGKREQGVFPITSLQKGKQGDDFSFG